MKLTLMFSILCLCCMSVQLFSMDYLRNQVQRVYCFFSIEQGFGKNNQRLSLGKRDCCFQFARDISDNERRLQVDYCPEEQERMKRVMSAIPWVEDLFENDESNDKNIL